MAMVPPNLNSANVVNAAGVNGVLQEDLTVPTGITGVQPLVITVGGASSQLRITVAVK